MAGKQTNLNRISRRYFPSTYPWREHNQFKLYVNGEEYFPAMLNAIDKAEQNILLEMYLFESGEIATKFIDALVAAAEKNVRVYLILDDFGCRGLKQSDKVRLQRDNISVHFYNPLHYGSLRRNLFRDHRKILAVDQRHVFIGGTGITDVFLTSNINKPGWRETMLEVTGACVGDWVSAFRNVWESLNSSPLEMRTHVQSMMDQGYRGRVSCTLGKEGQSIKKNLVNQIRRAQEHVWIATAYFVPSFKVRRALIKAAKKGVDVRLILPGPVTDHPAVRHAGRRFYLRLLRNKVKIYEYQPRFLHQKVLLCDHWISIGSSNIDRWNLRWNLEANQEIVSQEFAKQVKRMLERDITDSQQCHYLDWMQRPQYGRVLEWFWGKIDQLIVRLFR